MPTKPRLGPDTRAAISIVDVILGLTMLVAMIALSPVLYKFIGMASSQTDPFTRLLLQLALPLLFVGLIVSMGISAQRGA